MKTLLAICALIFCLIFEISGQKAKHPVILVPGDGGCQFEAKVHLNSTVHFICKKDTSDYFLLWVNPKYLLPYIIDCFVEIIRLERDPVKNRTFNPHGVNIRIPGFGDTSTVEWLSGIHLEILSYYNKLVEALVKKGYVRGKNIRGAPYDFRKAPNELSGYYLALKKLIEETYAQNSNMSVHLVAHSMGCPVTLYFLQSQTPKWKAKYIKSFISVAGVYSGSGMSFLTMASGENLGIPTVKPIWVRRSQRSWPSTHFLLPRQPAWNVGQVLGITDKANYTIGDYLHFFKDIGFPSGFGFSQSVANLTSPLQAPGVDVHCILTRTTPTPMQFDWRGKNWPDEQPKVINGEGDGTVNWASLQLCSNFAKLQGKPVSTKMIENTDHLGVLRDDRFAEYVASIV